MASFLCGTLETGEKERNRMRVYMYHKVIIFRVICTNNSRAREQGERERGKRNIASSFIYVYICTYDDANAREKKENVNYAEIRDDYPQSTLDEHIVS